MGRADIVPHGPFALAKIGSCAMLTLQEYKEAEADLLQRQLRGVWAMGFVFVIGIYVIPLGFVWMFRPDRDEYLQALAEWVVSEGIDPRHTRLIALLFIVPIGLLLALPSVLVLEMIQRYMRPDPRLFCPHCDGALNFLTPRTGNCPSCGRRSLDHPEADTTVEDHQGRERREGSLGESEHPLMSIEELDGQWFKRLRARDPKQRTSLLHCPRCHGELHYSKRRFYMVATRKCPHCGAPILKDPENNPSVDSSHNKECWLSIADFRASHATYRRWVLFSTYWLLLALVLLYLFGYLKPWWKAPLRRMVGMSGADMLEWAALLLLPCLAITAAWFVRRRLLSKLHMGCPYCGKSLFHESGIVIATRRCYHCGRRALAEPPGREPVAELIPNRQSGKMSCEPS
jgi:uncharacterized protein (DUF983 family)